MYSNDILYQHCIAWTSETTGANLTTLRELLQQLQSAWPTPTQLLRAQCLSVCARFNCVRLRKAHIKWLMTSEGAAILQLIASHSRFYRCVSLNCFYLATPRLSTHTAEKFGGRVSLLMQAEPSQLFSLCTVDCCCPIINVKKNCQSFFIVFCCCCF